MTRCFHFQLCHVQIILVESCSDIEARKSTRIYLLRFSLRFVSSPCIVPLVFIILFNRRYNFHYSLLLSSDVTYVFRSLLLLLLLRLKIISFRFRSSVSRKMIERIKLNENTRTFCLIKYPFRTFHPLPIHRTRIRSCGIVQKLFVAN